jgi:hypothetical protein
MEEEWMRDRALSRDLLEKTPHASPQELAQAIRRSVSWVKKWRKRLAEGDPHDPSLLCSCSQAHHAPYFRLRCSRHQADCGDALLSARERRPHMPGPRALLYYLPVTQSCKPYRFLCPALVRSIWKILHTTGCLAPHSKEPLHPNELRKPLEEIQHDLLASGRPVHLIVRVRRFFCQEGTCVRKVFAECFPSLTLPRVKFTLRLQEALRQLGFAVGGEAGVRLGKHPWQPRYHFATGQTDRATCCFIPARGGAG